jgi:hypothetical protein
MWALERMGVWGKPVSSVALWLLFWVAYTGEAWLVAFGALLTLLYLEMRYG